MRQGQALFLAAILGQFLALAASAVEPDSGKRQTQAEAKFGFHFADRKTIDDEVAEPSSNSPDGKVRLEIHGNKARLVETATDKSLGTELDAGTMWTEHHTFTFTCCCFSPDGKFVATGSEFLEGTRDVTDVGRVQVWDAASGKLLAQKLAGMGGVLSVVFAKDGKTVIFRARPCQIDGP